MPQRPVRRAGACAFAVACLISAGALVGCSKTASDKAYEKARAAYVRGDLAAALEAARLHATSLQAAPNSPWLWRFRLLEAEILTTQAKFREAGELLAADAPRIPELEQLYARQLIDRASLEINRHGDPAESIREARRIAKESELRIRLDLVEGALALDGRDHARAEAFFRAALDRAAVEGQPFYEALALNNLSVSSKRMNRYEDSIEYGQRALAIGEKIGANRTAALAAGNLGASYAYLGQFEAALKYETRAVQVNESIGAKSLTMTYLGELGLIYDRADRASEAIPHYRRAYELANELGLKRDAERFAENLALALIGLKQWDEAARWNEIAWALSDETRATASFPYLLRNRAKIAWGRGHGDEAAQLCRELLKTHAEQPSIVWEAHELLGEVHMAGKRYAEANRSFEEALRVIDRTRSDLLDPRNRITLLSRLIKFYREYVDALVAQNEDARALRVADLSRARVLAERLGRDVQAGRTVEAAALRAFARSADVRVLSFWIAPKRSFAWLIGPAGVRRFELPPEEELAALVTAHREIAEHSIADPLAENAPRALWDRLLAPIAASIPKRSRVIVIPDGPLHRLNLETLPAAAPSPHYWIEDVELAVAPSISIAMSKAAAPLRDGSLLAIGAPDYKTVGYEPLPGAAAEIENLRGRFARSSLVTGAQATPPAYRSAGPEKYSVIHFAAHAEANVEKPLESAVVLARAGESYKLHAKDVIDIPIHAELVTLSACKSAGAQAYAGEGLMGFAWAFLHAGAKSVVAGLWEVSDAASAPLMAKFYEGVAAGRGASCSLREAKLALLREKGFGKAFYWGAFQAYVAGVN
jgi:CHAT domain-containing protein